MYSYLIKAENDSDDSDNGDTSDRECTDESESELDDINSDEEVEEIEIRLVNRPYLIYPTPEIQCVPIYKEQFIWKEIQGSIESNESDSEWSDLSEENEIK